MNDEMKKFTEPIFERLGVLKNTTGYFGHRGWALGWGLGVAIGAKLAWPDRPVLAIESEGIRLAFTNYGAALTNLWINDTNGQEIDIVLGLDHADMYLNSKLNPYLNGMVGKSASQLFLVLVARV